MELRLRERVALVSAASQGLGYACALEGARVFLCSRDETRANEAARKIHEETGASVAFLASERASYITGVTLQVDGGWTRGLL